MQTLQVDLGDRSYPIYIGNQLLQNPELINPHVKGSQILIVSNETVAPLYLDQLKRNLSEWNVQQVILPDGEKHKHLDTVSLIYDALLSHRFDRSCTLIALGGGVVGDITGFAAATYQRGVNFIQVPTTLLAQVDSSVGGKTGVNHPKGKNMIGAFHQPMCVIADTDTLNTLPDNELSAGIAEVIKYGLIRDSKFFGWLDDNMDAILKRDQSALSYVIQRSCENKAEVVAADEFESGQRALLNLGHTFGHAIETAMGYGNWLHGEAVSAGSIMAADLSQRLGWLSSKDVAKIQLIFQKANLPVLPPAKITAEQYMNLMAVDKKVSQGKINLVLLQSIGNACLKSDYGADTLSQTLEHFCLHPRPLG